MDRCNISSILISLGLVILVLFCGCQSDKKGLPSPDTIVIAIQAEPARLNPIFVSDSISYALSELIFRGLTRLDDNMNITGDIAESWRILNGGLEIQFKLKKGVLWHDGREVTAEDVVFTFEKLSSPDTATPHGSRLGSAKEVKAIDRYTVAVYYHEPYGSAIESWSIGILPKHILEGKDINDSSFDRNPIGNGPYRLKEWVTGQRLIMESFSKYHNGELKIKNLVFRVIADSAARMMEVKSGGIDVMELTPYQYSKEIDSAFITSNYNKYKTGSHRYGFLGLNLLDDRFRERNVRQAIGYAIDKDGIINTVIAGLGRRSTGPYPPHAWYYSKNAVDFEYNPQKALQLLKSEGWDKGSDGLLRKNGKIFSFTIITNYESKDNLKTAQIIQQNLKAIGIQTEIQSYDWQTFRHKIINKKHFEAVILSRAYLKDPDIYDLWHSEKTREGEWNFLSYKNPKVDALFEKGRKTLESQKRQKIYNQIHEILADDLACIFLYDVDLLLLAHKKIKGITASPMGFLFNIEKWFLD